MSKRTKFLLSIGVIAALVVGFQVAAFATHYEATLEGSNFEIDNSANLVNNPGNSLIDWADLADKVNNPDPDPEDEEVPDWPEIRGTDVATGQSDDSYKGGVKEDTECPDETTGSIPNNKSDLRTFHVYEEPGTGDHPGFLNLAWSRVTDPSGTTLMDFEFNQSEITDTCAQGPNVVRQPGDLLIEYAIDQGGARANITVRTWDGSAWGPAESLTTPRPECPDGLTSNNPPSGEDWGPCASGTINSSPILAAASDGIISSGQLNARTFGEAQIDLRYIFDSESCESFGSAMLKSRSSTSFTSQLKDFIAPVGISLDNCGSVIVEKVDDGGNPLPGATFQLFQDNDPFGGTPGEEDTDAEGNLQPPVDSENNPIIYECTTEIVDEDGDPETTDDQTATCTIENVFFGNYWLDETVVPDGHSKASGLPTAVNINSTTPVTFPAPFENPRDTGSILVSKVDGNGDPLAGAEFALDEDGLPDSDPEDRTPIPAVGDPEDGLFCIDGLLFGEYNVVETVSPDGFTPEDPVQEFTVDTASTCAERTPTEENPEPDPDLTFVNVRNPGAILITKTAKDFSAQSGSSPLAGVEFTVTDSNDEVVGTDTTDASGQACVDGLTVGQTYTVTETGVPAGFQVDSTKTDDVTISDDATCDTPASIPEADRVAFTNDPLSEIEVEFRSLAGNRTAATIDCEGAGGPLTAFPDADGTPTAFDDSSETFTDLPEGTYNCTVVIDP